jgi:DNA-binding NarL/FixJ family response regulator
MGGRATVEGLSEVDPNVKAIVVSGYSNDTLVSDFKDYGFKAVITKPYQLSELSQVVSEISSEH